MLSVKRSAGVLPIRNKQRYERGPAKGLALVEAGCRRKPSQE
jgi:hypothetical protein